MKDFTPRLILLLIPALIALPLYGCHEKAPDSSSKTVIDDPSPTVVKFSDDAKRLAEIEVGQAQQRMLDDSVRTTGEIQANADLLTHVTTPVAGRIAEVLVRIGDKVQDGQVLLKVRSTDIQQAETDMLTNVAQTKADLKRDLMQIDSDMATAEAQIKLSASSFKRVKGLIEEQIASRADYETARTQYEKDNIALDALKRKRAATIILSEEKLKLVTEPSKQKLKLMGVCEDEVQDVLKTKQIQPLVPVLAPESGVAIERLVNLGELIDPSKPLFTIGNFHNIWFKADIYEKDIQKVKVGQPIELEVDSFPDEKFHGKLNYVADSLNPDTRTLTVRAEVDNPSLKLKPKMFARMTILTGERPALAIPTTSVQDAGSNKVVYVPISSNDFRETKVTLGREAGGYVEILSGLHPGEKVVTKGSFALRSGILRESS